MAGNKKEIDKELMYRKLMPSGTRTFRPAEEVAAPPGARAAAPAASAPELRKVSVPALDSRRTEVVNVMEAAVLGKLEQILSRFQCCRCDRCRKDIVALALNKLPPRYMVLPRGSAPPDIGPQLNAQVITAMIQAVIRVRAKPRH